MNRARQAVLQKQWKYINSSSGLLTRVDRLVASGVKKKPLWLDILEKVPPPLPPPVRPKPPKITFPEDRLHGKIRKLAGDGIPVVGVLPTVKHGDVTFNVTTDAERIAEKLNKAVQTAKAAAVQATENGSAMPKLGQNELLNSVLPPHFKGVLAKQQVEIENTIRKNHLKRYQQLGLPEEELKKIQAKKSFQEPPVEWIDPKTYLPNLNSFFAAKARNFQKPDPKK